MRIDEPIVVLDVHGVVLTNPLASYLAELAQRHGRESGEVLQTWASRLRRPFWLGELGEDELWQALFPGSDGAALTAELEQRYTTGPLFSRLDQISEPVWLLSNHRTSWLLPRLDRFGLGDRFERVFVSDAIGLVKPDARAFEVVQRAAGARRVTYVDDKPENVAVASRTFARAALVSEADRLLRAALTAAT